MTNLVEPTRTYIHEWYGKKVKVCLFGRPNDFSRIRENETARRVIGEYAHQEKIKTLLCPSATEMNKKIVSEGAFLDRVAYKGVTMHFGTWADGVILNGRVGFFIASADCPTLVLQFDNGKTVATHAGRECLFDRNTFNLKIKKDRGSVVFKALTVVPGNIEKVYVSIFCGIKPHYFSHWTGHSIHGKNNRDMIAHITEQWGGDCFLSGEKDRSLGKLDLVRLICAQLKEAGVPEKHIWHDGSCTFSDVVAHGVPLWWSHRRGDEGRNGVLVMQLN